MKEGRGDEGEDSYFVILNPILAVILHDITSLPIQLVRLFYIFQKDTCTVNAKGRKDLGFY